MRGLVPPHRQRADRPARLAGPALALALAVSAGPRSADAASLPRGQARMWVEENYARWGPYGVARSWDGPTAHWESQFVPENLGTWDVWLDVARTHQEGHASARGIPTTMGRLSVEAGDMDLSAHDNDPLRREFQPTVWLRGAAAELRDGSRALEIRGGALTKSQSFWGGGRTPGGADLLGFAFGRSRSLAGPWRVSMDAQFAKDRAEIGRHVARLFVGSRPRAGWARMAEARVSRQDAGKDWGTSLVAGAEYVGERYTVGGHLRRLSAGFRDVGLTADPHANEMGGRVEWAGRPAPRLHVGSSVDWARGLESTVAGMPPENRFFGRFFLNTGLPKNFSLQSNFAYRLRSQKDPDSLLVDQGVLSTAVDLGWRARGTGASIAYNRGINRDAVFPGNDWHEDRYSARVDRQFGQRFSSYLGATRTNRRLPNGVWTSRENRIEARLGWIRRERIWVSLARDIQEANDATYERDQWEIGLGWEQPLPWDLELGVDGITAIGVGQREPETARWSVRLARALHFGGGRFDPMEDLPEYGSIEGRVYDDLNGNGYPDPREPGIPGLDLKLGSGAVVTTGSRGEYRFPRAAIDFESVALDVSRLPARYLPPRDRRLILSLRPAQRETRDFAVRQGSTVAGRVTCVGCEGAAGIAGALVRLVGSHQDAFTDASGRFVISGIEPGTATFRLEDWSLPEGTRPAGSLTRGIELRAGAMTTIEDFKVEQVEPKVIQHFDSSRR